MPEVKIAIGGREFEVACQVGEEHFLKSAAALLNNEASVLSSQIGRLPAERMLLMAGLMLADKTAGMEEQMRALESKLGAQEACKGRCGPTEPAPPGRAVPIHPSPIGRAPTLSTNRGGEGAKRWWCRTWVQGIFASHDCTAIRPQHGGRIRFGRIPAPPRWRPPHRHHQPPLTGRRRCRHVTGAGPLLARNGQRGHLPAARRTRRGP